MPPINLKLPTKFQNLGIQTPEVFRQSPGKKPLQSSFQNFGKVEPIQFQKLSVQKGFPAIEKIQRYEPTPRAKELTKNAFEGASNFGRSIAEFVINPELMNEVVKKERIALELSPEKSKREQELENLVMGFTGGGLGKAKIGAIITGATAGSALATVRTPSKVEYKSKEELPKTEPAPTIDDNTLGTALAHLESSGGTNKANKNPGSEAYLVGLTTIARKELERRNRLPKGYNKNDRESVIAAGIAYFRLMQEDHPELTPAEIYADYYWGEGRKDPKKRQDAIRRFNEAIKL